MNRPSEFSRANTEFQIAIPEGLEAKIAPFARPAVERILRLQELNELHANVTRRRDESCVWDRILRSLNVTYRVSPDDLASIPVDGSLVVVANHPYGGIDGIILGALLGSVRSDVKVLANGGL